MSQAEDRQLARIRAILAQAEDPTVTPEEAEAFFAKAAELMAKYGIEKAMLADAYPELDRPADRVITVTGAYAVDRISLLNHILRPLGLEGIRLRDRRTGQLGNEVHVFGYESDIERAEMLFTSLLLQAFNGALKGKPRPGESVKGFRKTWLMGFSDAVEKRLAAAEAQARGEAPVTKTGRSAELVLADRKSVTRARYKQAYPSRETTKRTVRGSGYAAGERAGNTADLGAKRVASRGRRSIGS